MKRQGTLMANPGTFAHKSCCQTLQANSLLTDDAKILENIHTKWQHFVLLNVCDTLNCHLLLAYSNISTCDRIWLVGLLQ